MPLFSGPCSSRVSRPMPVLNSVLFLLFKLYSGAPRTLSCPPAPTGRGTRTSFTAGASAIPSGHSCSAISRHRWPSGAETVRDNFGRATTSDTSGAECCRLSGGRPPSTGSGHTQGPRSSGSSGSAVTVALPVGMGVDGPVLGVVGPVLGVGAAQCSGLPRVLGSSGLTRGPLSSQTRGSSVAAVSSARSRQPSAAATLPLRPQTSGCCGSHGPPVCPSGCVVAAADRSRAAGVARVRAAAAVVAAAAVFFFFFVLVVV